MNDNSGYWVLAGAMWTACLIKAPGLRHRRSPLYLTVCGVLLFGGIAYCCANPDVIGAVNAATGVPNFSAPLVYGLLTAESALILTLLVYWREGPEERARRAARRWQAAYGAVALTLVVLFVIGDAPEERRIDFDIHYAETPYIREMILLYLLAHTGAVLTATVLCIRWFAKVAGAPWLRRGLRVLILGFALNFGLDVSKFAAIGARWAGGDWEVLNNRIAPLFAFTSTLFMCVGFILPLVGERVSGAVSDVRTFVRLGPLWRALRSAGPAVVIALPVPWWEMELRLTRRVAEIQDCRLSLRPYRSDSVAAGARARAAAAGLPGEAADAAVEAAVLAAALAAKIAADWNGEAEPELDGPAATLPLLDRDALVRVSRQFGRPGPGPGRGGKSGRGRRAGALSAGLSGATARAWARTRRIRRNGRTPGARSGRMSP
ncbi:MAB_1171c family putative transporter [Streptomyces sp. NPDC048603]|uniref:MAB_1171c family putative transporter n=1 Tax=Streptomyces sp. NPDC048603 TaxID=3365577 RepID=UPI003717A46F